MKRSALIALACTLLTSPALNGYTYNPEVSKEVWETMEPFFLPEDHPVKYRLDRIFQGHRATQNLQAMRFAKFKHIKQSKWSHVTCAKHAKLKGFVIKAYLDEARPLMTGKDGCGGLTV